MLFLYFISLFQTIYAVIEVPTAKNHGIDRNGNAKRPKIEGLKQLRVRGTGGLSRSGMKT